MGMPIRWHAIVLGEIPGQQLAPTKAAGRGRLDAAPRLMSAAVSFDDRCGEDAINTSPRHSRISVRAESGLRVHVQDWLLALYGENRAMSWYIKAVVGRPKTRRATIFHWAVSPRDVE